MKKLLVWLGFLGLFVLPGCDQDVETTEKITLTGHFAANRKHAGPGFAPTQVLVFDQRSRYTLSGIRDGGFTVQVNRDAPVGLVFTNENQTFLGYLTLDHGFEAIPVEFLNDSVVLVDFGQLEDSVQTVRPTLDYVMDDFGMTPDLMKTYATACLNFSALVRNPDVDGNGKIDLLENRYYALSSLYFVDGGSFSEQTFPDRGSVNVYGYRIMLSTTDTDAPASVRFIFSDGTEVGVVEKKILPEDGSTVYFSDMLDMNSLRYSHCKISYGTDTLIFLMADQSATIQNMVYLYPELTYNASHELTRIDWEYYLGNTTTRDEQSWRILNQVQVQVGGTNYSDQLYTSPNLDPDNKFINLPQPIELQRIGIIFAGYYDNFGNNVVIEFKRDF